MNSENIKVSVVIPVYNIEEYVGKMLECVAQQTYKNFEVVIVNDGSTDNTLRIVEEKARLLRDVRVISIPNGGVSNARNVGMEAAGGGKLFFWDGDDTMEPDTIGKCIEFAANQQVNSVLYGYANKINGIPGKPHPHELNACYRGSDIRTDLMPHFLGHSFWDVNEWIAGRRGMRQGKEHTALWRMMFDADVIKKNHLRFDTRLSLGEDTKFINEYMLYEESIGFLDDCLYYLTIRETGANLTSILNAEKRLQDKTKLIGARLEIDGKARSMYGLDTHLYWEGTLVFSAVEMARRMAQNTCKGTKINYALYKKFLVDEQVKKAIRDFHPVKGLKAIPFWMLKKGIGQKLLFCLFRMMPTGMMPKR